MNAHEASALKILESYKKAVYDRDAEAFLALYDESFMNFDMWGPQWSIDKAAWAKSVAEWFSSIQGRVVVSYADAKVQTDEKIAVVTAYLTFADTAEDGKEIRSMNNRLTCVMKMTPAGWKITHEHTSAPADHATLKINLKRS